MGRQAQLLAKQGLYRLTDCIYQVRGLDLSNMTIVEGAVCVADNATHTMHNILTLRGAQVRGAHAWAGYLTKPIGRYASKANLAFA